MSWGHLDEQIQVEGELSDQEQQEAIVDAASLKEEMTISKKQLADLKTKNKKLSEANTAAKAEVVKITQDTG
jgi:hypothetical protein